MVEQENRTWDELDVDWTEYHADAKAILDEPYFWDEFDDYSPHGNDDGYDVLISYKEWRVHNAPALGSEFLEELLLGWGVPEINREDDVLRRMIDNACIAVAFAEIKVEGKCSVWMAQQALNAIMRRSHSPSDQRHNVFDKLRNKLLIFAPDYREPDQEINEELDELEDNLEQQHNKSVRTDNTIATVTLINSDPDGPVYVDARLSSGGRRFDSLPKLPGFPRWISQNEAVEIEMGDKTEILYKRASNYYEQGLLADQLEFLQLYRIGNPRGVQIKAFLTKDVRRSTAEIEELGRKIEELTQSGKFPPDNVNCNQNAFDEKWIARLRYKSSKYIIEPFVKETGQPHLLVFLRAVDRKSGKSGERLILEAPEYEALSLEKIEVKSGMVKVLHNAMLSNQYRARGFASPMEIPLELILNEGTDTTGTADDVANVE